MIIVMDIHSMAIRRGGVTEHSLWRLYGDSVGSCVYSNDPSMGTSNTNSSQQIDLCMVSPNHTHPDPRMGGLGIVFDEHMIYHRHEEAVTFDSLVANNCSMPDVNDTFLAVMTATQLLWAYKVGGYLQTIWIPIVVPIGFILSILVTVQKYNRKISCCIYMTGLAISDTGVLCVFTYYWASTDILKRSIHTITLHSTMWIDLFSISVLAQ